MTAQSHTLAVAVAERAAVIDALSRALDVAIMTGRTTGPEFDAVSAAIKKRDEVIAAELNLTVYEFGQLMGGN